MKLYWTLASYPRFASVLTIICGKNLIKFSPYSIFPGIRRTHVILDEIELKYMEGFGRNLIHRNVCVLAST